MGSTKSIQDNQLITPNDLHRPPSNFMKIPNADYLEGTGSEFLSARLWRLPPKSANTLHKHIRQEEFYFVLEGTGRMRVSDETLTVPRYGMLVGPGGLRQVLNDTDAEMFWLIVGAGTTGIPARRKDQARHVAHLPDRSDAIAQGTRRRAMAAEGVCRKKRGGLREGMNLLGHG